MSLYCVLDQGVKEFLFVRQYDYWDVAGSHRDANDMHRTRWERTHSVVLRGGA
jgi:hypothetical protein